MTEPIAKLRRLEIFSQAPWQMSYGERATLEGILAQLRPGLAIEIGRAEGGSLGRIALYSGRVISFDLVEPTAQAASHANVEILVGDSHRDLPERLERLAAEGSNVDFVLIDGDHSAEGARADMSALLESPAVQRSVILAHDSLNEDVRAGLEAVPYGSYEKVAFVDLDFVPGFVARIEHYRGQCWGGFGLVVVDEARWLGEDSMENPTLFSYPQIAWPWAQSQRAAAVQAATEGASGNSSETSAPEIAGLRAERDRIQAELDRHREWLRSMQDSTSWRVTAPLRRAKGRLRR